MDARDELWIRCPRLGGQAPFTFCLQEGGNLPCPRIITCWQVYFPIETHLKEHLSPQQWEEFERKKPKEKVASLLELIEEAGKTAQKEK